LLAFFRSHAEAKLAAFPEAGEHEADGTSFERDAEFCDAELRRTIQAATNKSERFNQFVQWVSFGGHSVIAENTRDEQRKFIKYNHLVANLLVFHNIVTLSRALERLHADGLKASDQALAALTPYQTEHINRFGNYTVNFSRTPEPLPSNLREPAGTESLGQASFDYTGSVG